MFLDANVLFSLASRADSGLRRLFELRAVTLCTSRYALVEGRRNLPGEPARNRLDEFMSSVELVVDVTEGELPAGVALPAKDRPILLSAHGAGANHLLTGDYAHFGPLYGRPVVGMLVLRPAEYLRDQA